MLRKWKRNTMLFFIVFEVSPVLLILKILFLMGVLWKLGPEGTAGYRGSCHEEVEPTLPPSRVIHRPSPDMSYARQGRLPYLTLHRPATSKPYLIGVLKKEAGSIPRWLILPLPPHFPHGFFSLTCNRV